ncbi:sensor histidine kinase [Paenibacillus chartarius]|uniref:Sensor histidine kinase n=1 Tax=Paenibacillus chartarius TaxID=747481 RepID=A0ABV6DUU2_9BACL
MNLVTKVMLLIFALMTPIIALYMYSNQTSINVVEDQINIANQNRLSHFLGSIEETMEQVSVYANIVTKDPDFTELAANAAVVSGYDYSAMVDSVERKLGLFSLSTSWMNRISVYFPAMKLGLSSQGSIPYDETYLSTGITTNWTLRNVTVSGIPKRAFTRHFVGPSSGVTDLGKTSIIVEVDLMEDNIVSLLNRFKTQGNNDPFLFRAGEGGGSGTYLLNASSDEAMVKELLRSVDVGTDGGVGKRKLIELAGKEYLVYALTSKKLGWTLVDYVPLEDILEPVTRYKNLFTATSVLLLLGGAICAFFLYIQVQVPIRLLTQSIHQVKKGQFSTRIVERANNEFRKLILQFNDMAAQIQHLVEKVYLEEIRSKEAVMKQLQSQINPHFLYNSLAFIVSMARLGRTEPIVSMGHSLADYYRYTTRNDEMVTTLEEEVKFVSAYVDIMNYQLGKIAYTADIAPSMRRLPIPRLLIQPVVENAIVHGLEPKPGGGSIRLEAVEETVCFRIIVTDEGVGMPEEALLRLRGQLAEPEKGDAVARSYGLWNVHERLRYFFGNDASLSVDNVASGGFRVVLIWSKEQGLREGQARLRADGGDV